MGSERRSTLILEFLSLKCRKAGPCRRWSLAVGAVWRNGSKPLRDALRQCWVYSALGVTCKSKMSIAHVLTDIPMRVVRWAVGGAMRAGR